LNIEHYEHATAKGCKTSVQVEECVRDCSTIALETVDCSTNTGKTVVQLGFIPKFQHMIENNSLGIINPSKEILPG
jgi:hypothetical protein